MQCVNSYYLDKYSCNSLPPFRGVGGPVIKKRGVGGPVIKKWGHCGPVKRRDGGVRVLVNRG